MCLFGSTDKAMCLFDSTGILRSELLSRRVFPALSLATRFRVGVAVSPRPGAVLDRKRISEQPKRDRTFTKGNRILEFLNCILGIINRYFNVFGRRCNTYLIIWTYLVRHVLDIRKMVHNSLGKVHFCEICDGISWEWGQCEKFECTFH